jgi:hypothetical protein
MILALHPVEQVELLLAVNELLPNEEYNETRVCDLAEAIEAMGDWTRRITVEIHSRAVMDGHHRLEAAKRLRLKTVPCLLLSYDEVFVTTRRQYLFVSGPEIVRCAKAGELYPEKSIRHIFQPDHRLNCEIPLASLRNRFSGHDADAKARGKYSPYGG